MGSMTEEGCYNEKGELVMTTYKGMLIKKDEMNKGEWKKMLADKNSFFGKLFMW